VTDAQQKITRIIQDMERKGELIISGRGGEEFI
jgi:flagellar motor switch protein FliG